MSDHTALVIQTICSMFSPVVAVVALFIAIRVEARTHLRFSSQLEREEELAKANIKPLITVYPSKFIDNKGITLVNSGLGTAIITGVTFSKGDKVEHHALYELFSFDQTIIWDYYWVFREATYYVQAGQKLKLLELSEKGLSEDDLEKEDIRRILESFQKEMDNLQIKIEYEDVLGNKQPEYQVTLVG